MSQIEKVYRVVHMVGEDKFVPSHAYNHRVRVFIDRTAAIKRAKQERATVLEATVVWGPLSER